MKMSNDDLLRKFYDNYKVNGAPSFEDLSNDEKKWLEKKTTFAWFKLAVAYNEFVESVKSELRKLDSWVFRK